MTPDQISKLPPELRFAAEILRMADAHNMATPQVPIEQLRFALTWGLQVVEERDAAVRHDYDKMLANWKNVCASDVFQELKHGKFRTVMYLLANGSISVGKAAQCIAEIAHSGSCSELPPHTEDEMWGKDQSWKDRAETAEATITTLTRELGEAIKALEAHEHADRHG